jgi:hypothetical protein
MKSIIKKLKQLTRYYPNVEKFVLERKNPIMLISTIIFIIIFGGEIWEKMSNFWFMITYRVNKNWINAFLVSCVVMLLYEINTVINNRNKKEKEKVVTILDRIIALIPFLWIVFAYNLTTLDYTLHFLRFGISRGAYLDFEYYFLNPSIRFYSEIPATVHYLIFFLEYASARRKIFSYFVRYQILQILLFQSIAFCFDHLLSMWVKYSGPGFAEETLFIGFNGYSLITSLIIYAFITILLGKETKLPFFDKAIQFHIGARNKGEDIL